MSEKPDQYRRVKALYRAAANMPPEERRAFLEAVCPDDSAVREEVEQLLEEETADLAEGVRRVIQNVPRPHPPPLTIEPGDRIGPYKVLRRIGEGGMGLVFEAEQEEPIHRRVALKIIKPGMDTRQVIARFESEREALALMNHPNIAKVLDAGTTERGLPFFVMEIVRGVPVTEYCDTHNLSAQERLELMVQVCSAVHHAHQKGIIHRDLKPSNILVTVSGETATPKIIDFGVAKALDRRLTALTLFTEHGQLIGTPEYMSPEQAEMSSLDIDTRTDVYSLGVLLYQMLVGALPFESRALRRAGYDEIRRVIREDEPPRPSVRLESLGELSSDVAAHRKTDLSTLSRRIRGDLDWITMKALEKDRTRRYESAAELAADIRRHLNDEPVLAGPPGVSYRARKFVKRHRTGVLVAAAAAVSLILGTVLATTGMIQAVRARQVAEYEATTANQVIDFLVGLFEVSDPGEARGRTITAREILDRGVARIRGELTERPRVRARLLEVMGLVYRSLGLYEDAAPLLEWSVEDNRNAHGNLSAEVAASLNSLGAMLYLAGKPNDARPYLEEALRIQGEVLPPDDPAIGRTLNNLGNLEKAAKRYDEALQLFQRSLAIRERAPGPERLDEARTLSNIGNIHQIRKDFDAAQADFERVLAIRESALGPDHPDVARTLGNLANVHRRAGRPDRARPFLERALAIRVKVLDADHPEIASTLSSLAVVAILEDDLGRAEELCGRALAIREKVYGPEHETTLKSVRVRAEILARSGREEEARALMAWLEARGAA